MGARTIIRKSIGFALWSNFVLPVELLGLLFHGGVEDLGLVQLDSHVLYKHLGYCCTLMFLYR